VAIYQGRRTESGVRVTRDGKEFDPGASQALWNHSPTGFEWGFNGSGPAQLALALLLDAIRHEEGAAKWHQRFKAEVVAKLPHDEWAMTSDGVRAWLGKQLIAELGGK